MFIWHKQECMKTSPQYFVSRIYLYCVKHALLAAAIYLKQLLCEQQ